MRLEEDLAQAIENLNRGAYTQYDIEVIETALKFIGEVKELSENSEKVKDLLSEVIERYGNNIQSIIAMEELSELQKEISKALRGKLNTANMAEEIADVLICIEQLKLMYDISDKAIVSWKCEKLNRLRSRLDSEATV